MPAFTLNGHPVDLRMDAQTPLLWGLRCGANLTGAKYGCGTGECGACMVMVDGQALPSCQMTLAQAQGRAITTIEGLSTPDSLHPMQAAFVKHDGYQCGYCTPGQICSAVAMLDEIRAGIPSHATGDIAGKPAMSGDEIRERMSGNLCRCGAYSNIVEAIAEVAARRKA